MQRAPLPVIVETDLFADVDDVGALALVHGAADRGAVELLAIGVNTRSRWGHRAVRVIDDFFGRPVPVGILGPLDDTVSDPDYARSLATDAHPDAHPDVHPDSGAGADEPEPEPAVRVHRRALAGSSAPVTVISLGFLTNLRDLLDSPPDDLDPRPGRTLVEQTVGRLVIMGGRFPEGREFNLEQDVPAAAAVLDRWPGRVDLLGFEVGAPVITGGWLSTEAADTPVGAAYRAYCGVGVGRESWDPLTVHLAVTDDPALFALSERGRVLLDPDGTSRFRPDPAGRHRIVRAVAPPEQAAAVVDALLRAALDGH